ncbi:unnamed protein product [Owenia fusiformis]|uniref:Pyridine nucleotide-disulfide oxidoreductase domain-containing protein 1 n=1 Tax=Owenia fusiformis TaxID=6347 RepID=A0A8J1TDX5_OWEFU|nr:unnamed protein product [Owenia fusiformis]
MEARENHGASKYIIIGGGIAGVSCAEMLADVSPDDSVLLLTASSLIKSVTNYKKIGKTLEEFDVEEKAVSSINTQCANVRAIHTAVSAISAAQHEVYTDQGVFSYEKLCICTGGVPKLLAPQNPHVIGIRDTESVKELQNRLANAQRILVVGNGGIATEIVYEIEGCDIIWAVKDDSITSTFVDCGAAQFFLPQLKNDKSTESGGPMKRLKYTTAETPGVSSSTKGSHGGALGPDWHSGIDMKGQTKKSHNIHVEYKVEVKAIYTAEEMRESGKTADVVPNLTEHSDLLKSPGGDKTLLNHSWAVYAELTNGKIYGCDFIISATGVTPCPPTCLDENQLELASDGGVKVDDNMRTNLTNIYAAGDICTASWKPSKHWHQMRLWSQARQMGAYAAQCMTAHSKGEEMTLDFCFEMFAHSTKFFNYKVILLGCFNAQGLGSDHELLIRVTEGKEYVKAVMQDGRMMGAILIGETDLEETFENLILNGMDLSSYGEDLLDPNVDIEDYFD